MGAVGPQRVDFPSDGTLPTVPAKLVENESSWLAFTDLVFVDPVGTGFSRIIEPEKKGDGKEGGGKPDDAPDPKEYFGYKRDLESLCEFMGRWLSENGRWGSPSSSPARATAAIAWRASRGCSRRPRESA